MGNGCSITAVDHGVPIDTTMGFTPLDGLMMGTRSGSTDEVLSHLSDIFFEDANAQIDSVVDSVEPTLAAFLTIAVGATLIAVMLPLIGIMGSIA